MTQICKCGHENNYHKEKGCFVRVPSGDEEIQKHCSCKKFEVQNKFDYCDNCGMQEEQHRDTCVQFKKSQNHSPQQSREPPSSQGGSVEGLK